MDQTHSQDYSSASAQDSGVRSSSPSPDHDEGKSSVKTRRSFLADAGRTLAYAAPVVLLFDPPEALAASGMSGVS
jgi:hypothetical protein